MTVPADNPIRRAEEDLLGRVRPASAFAEQVLSLDAAEGLVVGVLGPWGSGKTSFVNLARLRFEVEGITVLDFNPWMFSGSEQLVDSFFVELSSQLRSKPALSAIAKDLEDYGEIFSGLAWLPVVGPWIERGRAASKLMSKILLRRKEGVSGRRQSLETSLRVLNRPLVVVLDDLDRLTPPEIRDVFKLIRLTANFPNIIYLVAFDRGRVEAALGEQGIAGRDYLEKILQVGVDLPVIPDSVLHRQIVTAIDAAIEGVEPAAPFSPSAWLDVYVEVIRPLFRNMRDVRRYSAAVRGTTMDLRGQIELVDVLALEAIRVFLPDVFGLMPRSIAALTVGVDSSWGGGESPQFKQQVERLVEVAGPHRDVVIAMIERLFPAAQRYVGGGQRGSEPRSRWLRQRRVAHEEVLRLYLERVVGEGLQSFVDGEAALAVMADQHALDEFLRSLDRERLHDVIASLLAYEDEFSSAHAVPSITVLLNLIPELPARERGMLDSDTRMVVTNVVHRLLKTDKSAVKSVVDRVLPELTSLSAKLELVSLVGHREGRGNKHVSEDVAKRLEQAWRAEVRGASVNQLLSEPELLQTLYLAYKEVEPGEDALSVDPDPLLTAAILRSARSETRRQAPGSRAVTRSPRLRWESLVEIYGDEATFRTRLDELRHSKVKVDPELMSLADRYLSGWQPDDFKH